MFLEGNYLWQADESSRLDTEHDTGPNKLMSWQIKSEEYKIKDHLQKGLKHPEDMRDVLRCSLFHTPLFSLDEKTWISVKPNAIVQHLNTEHTIMQLMV